MAVVQARIAILEDSRGKVLVILPEQQLLHLALLNHSYQRALKAAQVGQVKKIFVPTLVRQAQFMDKLLSLPLILDHTLKDADVLAIYEPISGLRFELERSRLTHAQVFRFALTPHQIDSRLPTQDDEQAILLAVDRFTSLRIKERLADTLEIPPLPLTAQKIIMLSSNQEAGANELVPLVEADPSLAAQVISWASSPYYAAPGRVQSVKDAIVRVLGFDLVMNLALGLALNKTLKVPADVPQGVDSYWTQAVCCATAMEALVNVMPPARRPSAGMSYLAGLLHNFGYLVLAHVFPPHFSLINRYLECNLNLASHYVEKQVLGVTREQVGAWLLQCWQLPEEVWTGMRHMHNSDYRGPHQEYAHLLNLALSLLREQGIGHVPGENTDEVLFELLGLEPELCRDAIRHMLDEREQLNLIAERLSLSA